MNNFYAEQASSAVNAFRGYREKMELLMKVGDICDGRQTRVRPKLIDEAVNRVRSGENVNDVADDMNLKKHTIQMRIYRENRKAKK